MRHGEATDNVKEVISDKEIYWSVLTKKGKKTVKEAISILPNNINKMCVSPLPRTIQTAHYVYNSYPSIEVSIDNRLREIYCGKYSHCKNNNELDELRRKHKEGDYFGRYGDYGENRLEIEKRLSEFLIDIYNNDKDKNILIISHGSIISYIKRLLNLKSTHIKKGEVEIYNNIDFDYFLDYKNKLDNIKVEQ